MNLQRGKEKEPLEINLVPLIDVMMVILIFLMNTTTYNRYTELAINLPSADAECRHRAIRPSSTSKTNAIGISSAAVYACRASRSLRYFIASKIAATPQNPLAMVKKSAR